MFWGKREEIPDQGFDEIVDTLFRASGMSDEEVEAISSRLSYAAVERRIGAASREQAPVASWMVTVWAAKRAILAMSVITALATASLLFSTFGGSSVTSIDEALTGAGSGGVDRVEAGGTCALSNSDQCAMSTEEVLATIVSPREKEEPR